MPSQDPDSSVVYAITPETPFSPTVCTQLKEIGTIMEKPESRYVEYKAGGGNYQWKDLPNDIKRYGSAFLNSGGGILYIGVKDNGEICGIQLSSYSKKEDIKTLVKAEFRKFTPTVTEDLYEVKFIPCNRSNCYILQVSVRPGAPTEIYVDGDNKMFYRRDGSVEGPLWPCKIREIVRSKLFKELQDSLVSKGTK